MIALLGLTRRVDGMVVIDQVRMPLVGFRAEEPVVALEPASSGPVSPRRGQVHLVGWAQVPLADHVGVPATLAQDLGQHPVLRWDRPARVRKADRRLGDARHAVARVVASGQQAGPRGRAERGRVPLCVPHALRSDPIDVGSLYRPPVATHRREPDVVEHDVEHARGAVRRPRRLKRRPVWLRVANVDVDRPPELATRHASASLSDLAAGQPAAPSSRPRKSRGGL